MGRCRACGVRCVERIKLSKAEALVGDRVLGRQRPDSSKTFEAGALEWWRLCVLGMCLSFRDSVKLAKPMPSELTTVWIFKRKPTA